MFSFLRYIFKHTSSIKKYFDLFISYLKYHKYNLVYNFIANEISIAVYLT